MKKYKVTIYYRFVANGVVEKDFDEHDNIEARSPEHAKLLASISYGSKYAIFKIECVEIMTRQKMFSLTNPKSYDNKAKIFKIKA